jgi:hypothetical protein
VILVALLALPLLAQGEAVHGADAVFRSPSMTIAWAVLKNEAEEQTQVVIRVAGAAGRYAYLRIEGVNPFTGTRVTLDDWGPLPSAGSVTVRSPRPSFAEYPRRELHFYKGEADWRAHRPSLTVYYLGVPDTTPEFTKEPALEAYLDSAAAIR